jgi:hypothetical protein
VLNIVRKKVKKSPPPKKRRKKPVLEVCHPMRKEKALEMFSVA